jgi:hypothetical protein|nr:MAG TPA: hypothetical protein [Bacteriophage sp.]DAP35804.1 MAG TPA: hypothetical protein [Bacteriophage sp.]
MGEVLLLSELKRKIDLRSSLLMLPSVDELLSIVGTQNPDEQRVELYSVALEKWHYQVPLIRINKVKINNDPHKFINTFNTYARNPNTMCISEVELIPTRVWSLNGILGSSRNWIYQDGFLSGVSEGEYLMNATYMRPMYVNYLQPTGELDPKSCIGFIEERHVSKFVDACLMETLQFISQLRKNFEYPDVPVQMFNGIDEASSMIQTSLDQFYMGLTHGKIYV